jgi:hypothetical protein
LSLFKEAKDKFKCLNETYLCFNEIRVPQEKAGNLFLSQNEKLFEAKIVVLLINIAFFTQKVVLTIKTLLPLVSKMLSFSFL